MYNDAKTFYRSDSNSKTYGHNYKVATEQFGGKAMSNVTKENQNLNEGKQLRFIIILHVMNGQLTRTKSILNLSDRLSKNN